ncbi:MULTISPECIES: RasGEF domain-containing protein [Legionella]|uniref:RasGEF domain-containing protein n=1 Tax=Legionella resiliens TaxID=2905958 RepID=A0ABS8X053_9GAMM|nr:MULTISPECIES: RasGEF domain-containing protein [unclassified Legionella]MCE0721992.1 RasGEF domain-containing protein [Legionella sp. 9fVS26]MCE3531146.1 RasGEF domain-containing protein [Legionella sp. 8cVS16]QLZ70734.1 hypothetical protein FOLKNPGA_03551 [Legionella sp. PC1000]
MRFKEANRFKRRQVAKDFMQFSELFTELELSTESSSIEDETRVFEALDTLEEDLDDLSYLVEDTTHDDPLRDGDFLTAELPEALRILIAGFRPFKIDDFKAHCQNLINIHGFSKFRDAFDALFLHDEHLNKREMRAIKHINRYLMNRMMDTFAAITTEGSKAYAQGILEVLDMPDEFFREKALAAATKDKFQKAKKLAIKAVETETAKKIAEISEQVEKQKITQEEADKAIELIRKESSEQITAIEQMESMPLDYYIEAERRKMLVDGDRSRALFQSYDKVADFVLNDILAKSTMDERTVAIERYLLMAEKLVARNNFDTACQIYAAVQKAPVYRLAKTKEGLSTHTQKVLKELDKLYNNLVGLRARCEQEGAYLPLNFTVTDITFSTDEKNSFVLDSQGRKVKGCSGLAGMEKTIGNCQKATTSQSHLPDYMLLEEINRNQAELAPKTQKQINDEHDAISKKYEPSDNSLEPSPLLSKTKYKKIIRLGIVDPPKRSEQNHKLEELIDTLKHGIQTQLTRLKNLFGRDETPKSRRTLSILEEMQDGVPSLFDKISSFFHDKLKSLSMHSSKHNRDAFFQLKDAWSFANEDDEDREDEHLSL